MTTAAQVDLKQLTQIATPVIEGAGYELVDLEWKREAGAWVLRFFIDKPGGPHAAGQGITLDGCAEVSSELSTTLDVSEALPGSDTYSLEVSSPGIDRPLRRVQDFQRSIGQKVRIRTQRPLGSPPGRRNYAGSLVEVVATEPPVLMVDVGDRTCEVPLSEIEKAHLEYDFEDGKKPAAKAAGKPGAGKSGAGKSGKSKHAQPKHEKHSNTSHGSGGSR